MKRKITTFLSLTITKLYLLSHRRHAIARLLVSEDVEKAASLLTEQFSTQEPLCRNLELQPEELFHFFRLHVQRACDLGLGIVVTSPQNEILGAILLEDLSQPFIPDTLDLSPALQAIGDLLEHVPLPEGTDTSTPGVSLYCSLVAIKRGKHRAPLLIMLIAAISYFMLPKGYKKAYAKVTNPRVITRVRSQERRFRKKFFTLCSEIKDSDFPKGRFAPLEKFHLALIAWPLDVWFES